MCTSLTYRTADDQYWLARTMDFQLELGGQPIAIPRNFSFKGVFNSEFTITYGFVGTGANMDGYVFVDGVNEQGLAVAALYFSNEAGYQQEPVAGKLNLASFEVLSWLLGTHKDVADVHEHLDEIAVVNYEHPMIQDNVPLHWIITDRSGNCRVLEVQADGFHWYDDTVGVMTNSPNFAWHQQNLSNYIQVHNGPQPERKFNDFTAQEVGPGSGMIGIPGDYTSVSRFVRAAYTRQYTEQVVDELALNTVNHMLEPFDIPKGVKQQGDGFDYTQYRAYMQLSNATYYYQAYGSTTINAVHLTEDLLNKAETTEFSATSTQEINNLN